MKILIFLAAFCLGLLLPFLSRQAAVKNARQKENTRITLARQRLQNSISDLSQAKLSGKNTSKDFNWVLSAKTTLQEALDTIEKLQDELERARDEKNILETSNKQLIKSLKVKDKESKESLNELRRTRKEKENLEQLKVDPLKDKLDLEVSKNNRLTIESARLNNQAASLKESVRVLSENNKLLNNQLSDAQNKRTYFDQTIGVLQQNIDEQSEKIKNQEGNLYQLKAVLSQKEDQLKLLEDEQERLASLKNAQEDELVKQKKTIDELKGAKEDSLVKSAQLQKAREDNEAVKNETLDLKTHIAELEKGLQDTRDNLQELSSTEDKLKEMQKAAELKAKVEVMMGADAQEKSAK